MSTVTIHRALVLALLSLASELHAQDLICALEDSICWQRQHEQMCRVQGATTESCENWLRSLEQLSTAWHPNIRLTMAAAHVALSDLSAEVEDKDRYRSQALQLYRDLARDYPATTDAWLGLSAFAESRDERVAYLREAAATAPTDDGVLELLAKALVDPVEIAATYEQAYDVATTDTRRLHLAAMAVPMYERAGATERAEAFRARVRADFAIDALTSELAEARIMNPDRVSAALEQLCTDDFLAIFGADICLRNVEKVLETGAGNTALLESASRGMFIAAQHGRLLSRADPGWRQRFENALDELVAMGAASGQAYTALAFITQSKEKRLRTMREAAERFPSDGELTFGLGLAEFDAGNQRAAIEALTRARDLLPESRRDFVDQMLRQASALQE